MANDGSLKLSQQGGFDLGLFVGGRHHYKNNNLVQGKQTVRYVDENIIQSKDGIFYLMIR